MGKSRELPVFQDARGKLCGRCVERAGCPGIAWWEPVEKSCFRARTASSSGCAWRPKAWHSEEAECGWKSINTVLIRRRGREKRFGASQGLHV